jgi:hypothetical protein
MADAQQPLPSREDLVLRCWDLVNDGSTKPNDVAKLCRVIAQLQGYNRGEDYSDLEEQLRQLEMSAPTQVVQPEVPWWEKTEGEAS